MTIINNSGTKSNKNYSTIVQFRNSFPSGMQYLIKKYKTTIVQFQKVSHQACCARS